MAGLPLLTGEGESPYSTLKCTDASGCTAASLKGPFPAKKELLLWLRGNAPPAFSSLHQHENRKLEMAYMLAYCCNNYVTGSQKDSSAYNLQEQVRVIPVHKGRPLLL